MSIMAAIEKDECLSEIYARSETFRMCVKNGIRNHWSFEKTLIFAVKNYDIELSYLRDGIGRIFRGSCPTYKSKISDIPIIDYSRAREKKEKQKLRWFW